MLHRGAGVPVACKLGCVLWRRWQSSMSLFHWCCLMRVLMRPLYLWLQGWASLSNETWFTLTALRRTTAVKDVNKEPRFDQLKQNVQRLLPHGDPLHYHFIIFSLFVCLFEWTHQFYYFRISSCPLSGFPCPCSSSNIFFLFLPFILPLTLQLSLTAHLNQN